jgi:hypothetical protein
MKIQVLKNASGKVRVSDPCPYLVEIPPEAAKK